MDIQDERFRKKVEWLCENEWITEDEVTKPVEWSDPMSPNIGYGVGGFQFKR